MAATDISALVKLEKTSHEFVSVIEQRVYDIDVTTSAYTGIETVATHNLIPIPEGYALLSGKVIVETSVTSGGNATVQFKVGSDVLTGALPKANLAAGDVFTLVTNDLEDTSTVATYAKAAADTLDMTVGTAALTAGRLVFVLDLVKVADLFDHNM